MRHLLFVGSLLAIVTLTASCTTTETTDAGDTADAVTSTEAPPTEPATGGEPADAGRTPAAEEAAAFNVLLVAAGERRIQVIAVVREVNTDLGLKAAKDLVESAPNAVVAEKVTKERAEAIRAKLEAVGATVEIRPAD